MSNAALPLQLLMLCCGAMLGRVVAQAQNPSTVANDCFSTIQSLQDAMDNRTDLFSSSGGMVDYILCPNTQFSIGLTALTPRTLSRIRCGTTGESTNNCTFQGGIVQVLVTPSSSSLARHHIVFEGLTFESAGVKSNGITVAQRQYGSLVVYRDCVFRYQTVALTLSSQEDDDTLGAAAPISSPVIEVMLAGCRFESNAPQAIVQECRGLICVAASHLQLSVRNSIFIDNDYASFPSTTSQATTSTFLIDVVEGGRLELDQNCFVNNSVIGTGMVLLYSARDLSNDSNYGRNNRANNCAAIHTLVPNECLALDARTGCDGWVDDALPETMPIDTTTDQPTTSSSKELIRLGWSVLLSVLLAWL